MAARRKQTRRHPRINPAIAALGAHLSETNMRLAGVERMVQANRAQDTIGRSIGPIGEEITFQTPLAAYHGGEERAVANEALKGQRYSGLANQKTAPVSTPEPSGIAGKLQTLHGSLDELSKAVGMIESRISPVLRAIGPADPTGAGIGCDSEISSAVASAVARVQSLTSAVHSLRDRVDL